MAKPNDIYKSYIGSQFLSDMLGKPIKSIFIGPQWAAYFGTNLQMPFELRGQFAGIALALSQFAGLNKITADDVFILLKKDIWETGEETPYKQMERFAESLVNHSDPFSVRLNERMVFHKIEFDDHAEDDVNPNESNHFSIKLFLECNLEIGAKRIFEGKKRATEHYYSINSAIKKIKERNDSDKARYEKYYNLNPYNKAKFDLVVDTSDLTIKEVLNKLLDFIE